MDLDSQSLPLSDLAAYLPLSGPQQSNTERISALSDRLFYPLVSRASKKYSEVLGTPEHFVKMLLLVEDKRFLLHPGVDPIAIVRALTFNAQGKIRQGASTITQQLYNIRRRSLTSPRRAFSYKLKQALWAFGYYAANSRSSLLTEYVDSVYWGRSYYGLDAAARGYFSSSRTSLTPAQSFFLAERIAMPNAVSPFRLVNLMNRSPVRANLLRHGATTQEVMSLYHNIYGPEAKRG
jgi:membrane peptidoglycan carboxypeptidase